LDPAHCPICGSDALVTIVARDESDSQLRSVCRDCQRRAAERERSELTTPFEAAGAPLLVFGGIVLAALTVTADHLPISGRTGFGWRQITGLELGFLATVLGLVSRKALVAIVGLLLLVLSLGADLLQVGHVRGFGWRSQLGMVVAAAMFAGGVLWRRSLARRSAGRGSG
jgi:hypothetical protein